MFGTPERIFNFNHPTVFNSMLTVMDSREDTLITRNEASIFYMALHTFATARQHTDAV